MSPARPDSAMDSVNSPARPVSTIDNADWSFALREATIYSRFPNGDLELSKMGNNELDRLYAEILKVRSSRTASSIGEDRSESRMSLIDSVTDEEEEEDDWTGSPRRRIFSESSSWSTPGAVDRLDSVKDEEEGHIERDSSIETRMGRKLALLESKVKQLSLAEYVPIPPELWIDLTEEETSIAKRVMAKWKKRRRVGIAASALIGARDLKEANVMSMELKKGVTMQFVVIEEEIPSNSISPSIFDSALSITPQLGIKVLDRRKPRSVHLWSINKFRLQLSKMRNLHKFIDQPSISQHFASNDPFSDGSSPESFVGSALFSLLPLARTTSFGPATIQIYSPYISDPIGSCRIHLVPTLQRTDHEESSSSTGNYKSDQPDKLLLEISIDQVQGFESSEFSSIRIQLRPSHLFGADFGSSLDSNVEEDVICSPVFDLTPTSTPVDIHLRQTIEVNITPSVHHHFAEQYASVYFFGRVKISHLDKILRWDEARDSFVDTRVANSVGLREDPFDGDVTRRSENELMNEQKHDILLSVEIQELSPSGDYISVPVISPNQVEPGAFMLRQGLQRKILIRCCKSIQYSNRLPIKLTCAVPENQLTIVENRGNGSD